MSQPAFMLQGLRGSKSLAFFYVGSGIKNFGQVGPHEPGVVCDGGLSFFIEPFKDYYAVIGCAEGFLLADYKIGTGYGGAGGSENCGFPMDSHGDMLVIDAAGSGDPNGVVSCQAQYAAEFPEAGTYTRFGGKNALNTFHYLDCENGYLWQTNASDSTTWTLIFAQGSGSPEGTVTASPNCKYWDRTAKRSYIKNSGTNTNTGWAHDSAWQPWA